MSKKYLIVVPDGSGDDPIESLGGKTPLEVSSIENINALGAKGVVGMVKTIPDGIAPGSDAANLSVMGYDPSIYLTGRSPLEAVSMGIEMSDTDVAFRTNIITLERKDGSPAQAGDTYEDLLIKDHSSGDISNEEAAELIKAVSQAFSDEKVQFYPGVSYRHCMIVRDGSDDYKFTPPHDVLGRCAGDYMPMETATSESVPRFLTAEDIGNLQKKSFEVLNDHPVNQNRRSRGLNPANTIWIWGQGKKPALSSFYDKYGITGTAISAVDLIKGIALCAGLDSVDVEGATGTIHTNFKGKAQAAIEEFKKGKDFIYMHLEAPDECSHQGDMEGKIASMDKIDKEVVKPLVEYLKGSGHDYRILVVPDHRTPMAIRTHSSDPVPFVIYDSQDEKPENPANAFNEVSGSKGLYFNSGVALADYYFTGAME